MKIQDDDFYVEFITDSFGTKIHVGSEDGLIATIPVEKDIVQKLARELIDKPALVLID